MKKFCSYSLALLTAALLTACSEDYDNGTAGKGTPLTLTAGTDVATRAASNIQSTVFDAGETLNAYITAKKEGADIVIGAPAVCTTKAAEGGKNPLTAMPQPYFPFEGGYTLDVYALYPAKVTSGVTSFAVSEDQKADGEYKASDLMWAGDHSGNKALTGIDQATTTTIDLPFRHKMAKLIVKVAPVEGNGGNGVGTVSSIRLKNVYRNIGFSPQTGQLGNISTLTNIGDIELGDTGLGSDVDGDNVGDGNACLFPPQTVQGDFLEVVTTSGTAKFAIVGQKNFDEGEEYTVTISLSAGNMGKTAAIADWPNDGEKEHHLKVKALGAGSLQVAEIADIDPDNAATKYTENGTTKYKPQSLTVTCNGVTLTEGTDYTAVYYNNAAAGQYGVVVVTGIGNYADAGTGAQTFLIKNGQINYAPEPTAAGTLVYNGSAQSLLGNEPKACKGAPDAEIVPIKYCATETGYYSATPPTATNAGTYYFWYKVDDKDGYSGIPPRQCGPIVIQKADLDLSSADVQLTRPTAKTLTYNEKYQQLVNPASCSVNGNPVAVTYCLGTDATTAPTTGYTAEIPTALDAGTYYVWWQVGGDNYYGTTPECVTVTVEKGPGRINFSPTSLKFDITDRKGTKKIVTIDRAGNGTVTATCSNENIAVSLNADGTKMTVTRMKEGEDITGLDITVTVAESNNCYDVTGKVPVTVNKCELHLNQVKSTDQKYLGYIVSTTGNIYPDTEEGLSMLRAGGGTPAGIICYVGEMRDAKGFVMALSDANSGNTVQFKNLTAVANSYYNSVKIQKQDGTYYAWKVGSLNDYWLALNKNCLSNASATFSPFNGAYWTSHKVYHSSGIPFGDEYEYFYFENFYCYKFVTYENNPHFSNYKWIDSYWYKVRLIIAF